GIAVRGGGGGQQGLLDRRRLLRCYLLARLRLDAARRLRCILVLRRRPPRLALARGVRGLRLGRLPLGLRPGVSSALRVSLFARALAGGRPFISLGRALTLGLPILLLGTPCLQVFLAGAFRLQIFLAGRL